MAHWKMKLSALLAASAMVAGCGGGSGAPLGAPDSTEDSGPADLGGEDLKGEPIKVGFLVDQTGALADYGHAHRVVGEAAARRINENGGIDGRPIELVIADTESDPSAATPRARQLVESENVDFLLGSNTSGVVLAVAGVAKETETVYFATAGGALLGTPANANRYVFDFNTNVRQETNGAADFIKNETDATKWGTVVADYAWGWDQEKSFAAAAKSTGLTVDEQIRAPLGTSDFLGYLRGGLAEDTEGVYFANFGTDFLAFIRDLNATHPDIVKVGGNYVLAGQEIADLGDAAEGTYVVSGYPQSSAAMDSEYDKEYRAAIGMDDQGRETKTGSYLVASYQWSTWESLNAIKAVAEETGWKSSADTMEFIKALEGHEFEESADFPSGSKHFRPEDHVSVKDIWMEEIKDGDLTIGTRIPAEAMLYEPMIDYTAED